MPFSTLIDTHILNKNLHQPNWAIIDCRFSLADTERGRKDYEIAHIPGAVYAHLDEDLSGPIHPGVTGRHPLPSIEKISNLLSGWGIDANTQVAVYDDFGGGIAARLWWMLKWLGHDKAAVLDGGYPKWETEGLPTTAGIEQRPAAEFVPSVHPSMVVSAEDVLTMRNTSGELVLDARGADRYRGENETIDPVAGHIPGAVSAPYAQNLNSTGVFLSKEELKARFEAILKNGTIENTAVYCGSGVTAAHNILAMAHAGLGMAKLYAGSWSEWITDPNRPTSTT